MKRIIKKYPNRRLYDTSLGVYITLDDVRKLVVEHADFQVVDARTQKDLTQTTLLQIINEQEAGATPIFSTPLLQEFIRLYHQKSQKLFGGYLEQAVSAFQRQKDFFSQQLDTYQKMLTPPAPVRKRARKSK